MARTPLQRQQTSPSRQQMAFLQNRAPAEAFGANIARAFGNMGGAIRQGGASLGQAISLFEQRASNFRDANTAADTSVEWAEAKHNYIQNTDPNDPNYARNYYRLYQDITSSGTAQMTLRGQQSYGMQFRNAEDTVLQQGLVSQAAGQSEAAVRDLSAQLEEMQRIVFNDPSSLPEMREAAAALVANATVPAAAKGAMADQFANLLERADVEGRIERGEITQADLGLAGGRDQYFASIKSAESGGRPDAKNPNSSATGLYQFTSGTWNRLRSQYPELGLTADGRTDPAQQERAIRVFTEENARLLEGAGISANNGNLYAAHFLGADGARQVLSAPDDAKVSDIVSPGVIRANSFLRSMTVADFKEWANAKGNGTGVATNRFPNLTFRERLDYAERIENQRQQNARLAQQSQTNARNDNYETLYTSVIQNDPNVTRQTVIDANRAGGLSVSQTRTLLSELRNQEAVVNAEVAIAGAQATGMPVDPTDSAMKKASNRLVAAPYGGEMEYAEQVAAGNPDAIQAGFHMAASAGVVPPAWATAMTSTLYGADAVRSTNAALHITQLADRNGQAANAAFSQPALARANAISTTATYLGGEAAIERAAWLMDPANRQMIEGVRDQGSELFDDRTKDWSFDDFASAAELPVGRLSGEAPSSYLQARFESQARTIWVESYVASGNVDAADEMMSRAMKKRWGYTALGVESKLVGAEAKLVEFPPEQNTQGWTQETRDMHIRSTLGVDQDRLYELIATGQTENRVQRGLQPTYQAYDPENFQMYTDEFGRPLVIDFAITPEIIPALQGATELENLRLQFSLNKDYLREAVEKQMTMEQLEFFGQPNHPEMVAQNEEVNQLMAEQEALQEQIEMLENTQ